MGHAAQHPEQNLTERRRLLRIRVDAADEHLAGIGKRSQRLALDRRVFGHEQIDPALPQPFLSFRGGRKTMAQRSRLSQTGAAFSKELRTVCN
jgi:hypothetical protein